VDASVRRFQKTFGKLFGYEQQVKLTGRLDRQHLLHEEGSLLAFSSKEARRTMMRTSLFGSFLTRRVRVIFDAFGVLDRFNETRL
jgi:hypothetical protein